jgi:predicted RNase H-like nuclease (RuvC/YqgF family)
MEGVESSAMSDMAKRLKKSQDALYASQQSYDKTKAALQKKSDSLKYEQDKNERLEVVIRRLNERIDLKIHEHEVEINHLKTKVHSLQNMEIMQQNVEIIKMFLPTIVKKLDDIKFVVDVEDIGDKRKRSYSKDY